MSDSFGGGNGEGTVTLVGVGELGEWWDEHRYGVV